jgi:methanogenic corrinoid protein MtbC1
VSLTTLERVAAGQADAVAERLQKYNGLVWSLPSNSRSVDHYASRFQIEPIMQQDHTFSSHVLRHGARALAGYAATDLLETHPDVCEGVGPDPFAGWQAWLANRVDELAAALAAGQPRLFADQAQWAVAVATARGITPDRFRAGLQSLQLILAEELPAHDREAAIECVDLALKTLDEPPCDTATRLLTDSPMGRLAVRYLLKLLEGDRRTASQLVLDEMEQIEDVRQIYLDVLLPVQKELGRMWMTNEISLAEEHFASQATRTLMAQLLFHADFRPANGKTAILAAVAGNHVDMGLQVVADFFEMDGWRTIHLGANVPAADLAQAADCFQADLVGLSVALVTQLETLKATIQAVRNTERGERLKILVGGRAVATAGDLPQTLGADGYAADPRAAVEMAAEWVGLHG